MSHSESKHICNVPQPRSKITSTTKLTFSYTNVLTIILTIFLKDVINDLSIFPGSLIKHHKVIWRKKIWLWMVVLPTNMHTNLPWSTNIYNFLLSVFLAMQKSKGGGRSLSLAPPEQEKNPLTFSFTMIDSLTECRMVSIQSQNFDGGWLFR